LGEDELTNMLARLTLDKKIPPPVVGALVAALMWSVSTLGPHWTLAPVLRYSLAGLLAATGMGFDLAGLLAFRAARTTFSPLKPEKSSSLVTGGVYRVTRNPMYLGLALVLSGWAVWLAALLPWLGPVFFVAYVTRFQIGPEERVLRGIFGEAYSSYAARVRRWL
jgi:protein-S-isoprenylcysteine O-methyltransferase Ste14